MVNLCELKGEAIINYPTFWEFKVILEQEIDAKKLFEDILKQREFHYKHSHHSKNGKYQSYLLSVFVDSKIDRLEIFEKLKVRSKFVL